MIGHHLVQHDGRAAFGAGLVGNGAVARRGLQHACQEGRLADRKLGSGLVEIALGGRLDAVGAGAEIDPVEIQRQDLLLRELGFQPNGQHQLLGLAVHVLGWRQEQVARQLLGDGRAAPECAVRMGDVVEARPDDAPGVETEVVVELPVLDGHEGAGHVAGQGVQVHRRGVLAAAHRDQGAGAVQVADRGLMLDLVELGRVGQAARQHGDDGDDQDGQPDAADGGPVQDRLHKRARRAVARPARAEAREAEAGAPLFGGAAGSFVGHVFFVSGRAASEGLYLKRTGRSTRLTCGERSSARSDASMGQATIAPVLRYRGRGRPQRHRTFG